MLDPNPVLTTERLILRKLTASDAAAVYAYARDPEVARYTSWQPHTSQADAEAYIAYELARYAAGKPATWAIEARATGRVLGGVGFVQEVAAHRKAEIGYVLARDAWGQGFMPEAVGAVLGFAFVELGLQRVEAYCKVGNAGSARVMEKANMAFEGLLRAYVWKDGRPHDVKMYSILAPDWRKQGAPMITDETNAP